LSHPDTTNKFDFFQQYSNTYIVYTFFCIFKRKFIDETQENIPAIHIPPQLNPGSPIPSGFAPGSVNYKKRCTQLAVASDKVYQLLAHGQWFSPGTLASSTTKTGRHDFFPETA
jgi:hypothetical protein